MSAAVGDFEREKPLVTHRLMGQGLDKQLDCRSTWSNPKRSTPVSAQGSTNIRLRAQAISLEACKCASRMTARLDQKKRFSHRWSSLFCGLCSSRREPPRRPDSPETTCPTPVGAASGLREPHPPFPLEPLRDRAPGRGT